MRLSMHLKSTASLLLLAALSAGVACKKAVPGNVAATVNGRALTYAEIDKQYKRQFPQQPTPAVRVPSDESFSD